MNAEALAKQHLDVETLALRNRDHLDFYDVSVSSLSRMMDAQAESFGLSFTPEEKEALAVAHTPVETLTVRNNDSLDFYDMAVWTILDFIHVVFDALDVKRANG